MHNLKPALFAACLLGVFCRVTPSLADSESAAIFSNNPVAFYQLNETVNPNSGGVVAVDSAGANNATYGTACQNGFNNITGPRPQIFSGFAPTNWAVLTSPSSAGSFVTCPAWNLNTNTVTIMAWINPSAVVQWAGIVFCRAGKTVAGLSLNATTSGGSPEMAYNWNNDGNNWGWHSGLYAPLNQWSLVTLVVTSTNATIYLSAPSGTTSATHTYAHPNQNFDGVTLIGQDSAGNPARTFSGSIDDVAVFNQSLSKAQVQAIYNTAAPPAVTVDTTKKYQTIEGLGGATAFWVGNITGWPYAQEVYTNAFAGLNLSMLRLGDWYNYGSISTFDTAAATVVANANRVLGHPVPIYMSSWTPPAFLKNNGQTGNGTLRLVNGSYDYAGFAQYWYDSINAYRSNGISPTWISIQNEPDFNATYGSCLLLPTENQNGNTNASYSLALNAVYNLITNLPSPPKILAPEPVHISYGDLSGYATTLNSNNFYGVNHHLYGDGGSTGDSFISALNSTTNIFPNKPHFMTEYGDVTDMIECANLIHNELTIEQVSGYNHWSLVYPGGGGLVTLENSSSSSTWTNAPAGIPEPHGYWLAPCYWSMKHFSFFIQPGYRRVSASDNDSNVRSTAYLSPDGLRLVLVLINTNPAVASALNFNLGGFTIGKSIVYQTANTNYYFQPLGSLTNGQVLPPRSLTTIVLDQLVNLGSASNPSPTNGASGVALNVALSWLPGSNVVSHAVYFGTSSNAVAQAVLPSPQFQWTTAPGVSNLVVVPTAAAPAQFQGLVTTTYFSPVLLPGMNYFWRVDEIAGTYTNTGPVWSFATLAPQPLQLPWLSQDIGTVGVTGSASYNNGVFVVTGAGADIQSTADAFRYAYQTVTGDCSIIARVSGVQGINAWSKASVMIRETLAAGAANAFIGMTPSNGVTWQYRSSTGGVTGYNNTTNLIAPYWVKLVRTGNTFTGYDSPDGVSWTQQGTTNFTMASTMYIGLAVTSHNITSLCTATFDNVNVQVLGPAGLSAAAVSSSQINLVWNTFTNAASYNVKRSVTNGGPYTVVATGVATTNYVDSGLNAGTIYYYVVSAVVSGSETSNSVQVAAATLSGSYGSLLHRYSFSETGGSSVGDSVGGPVWNGSLPNGGTLGGGQLTLSGNASQYVSLPMGIVGGLSNLTVMAWVNLNTVTNWARIFDFGNSTAVAMYLTEQNGGTTNLYFAITTNSYTTEQPVSGNYPLSTGVWHQVVLTLNGSAGMLYLDGNPVGTNAALTLNPVILGNTTNNYLGKSQWTTDPYYNGQFEEFRIYNAALAPAEVAATYALGTSQLLSTSSPQVNLTITTPASLTLTWPLASAGFTVQSRTNLFLGDWLNVTSPAPQIVGGQWQVSLPTDASTISTFYRILK